MPRKLRTETCKVCGKKFQTRGGKTGQCWLCSRSHPVTAEMRQRMSEGARKIKHWNWKGDAVGYAALHYWIKARKPKPSLCEWCKEEKPLDLANKGVYDRNLDSWEWLCRRCHMKQDGRYDKLPTLNQVWIKSIRKR